jgi:hypothetical protein
MLEKLLFVIVTLSGGVASTGRRPVSFQPGSQTSAQRPRFLGEFSNVRYSKEHAYGVAVELWQTGGSVFGLLDFAEGLEGDTPAGLLEDVEFDAGTGRISFKAKLSLGIHYCARHPKGIPSRDLFEFSGKLTQDRLAGTLVHSDVLHAKQEPSIQKIVLDRKAAGPLPGPVSYQEWRRWADAQVKRRGPKW